MHHIINESTLIWFMVFAHIIDDYCLQGILASLKQKDWWKKQPEYQSMYKYDYIVALLMHSFSWSFMIHIPLLIMVANYGAGPLFHLWYGTSLIINLLIHAVVDDLKANRHKINLVVDQSIHLLQIVITCLLVCMMH